MPFYTFKCPNCEHMKELLQGMNDPAPFCSKCTKKSSKDLIEMKRVYKPTGGFNLKGSGWHNNDYDKHGPKQPEIEITHKKK